MVNSIRDRALKRELCAGTFLNLGSSVSAEMAGKAGFDWVLIDIEHGMGDQETLVHQLQAVSSTPAVPIVRIAWNDPPRFKRVLDVGAAGVMVPYVSTVAEAEQAVASVRYPPWGIRGVAKLNRASGFGKDWDEYYAHAHERLLTVVQIESQEAVDCIEDIAAVDGVDVLFIGPMDLSTNMGISEQYDDPRFLEARRRVAEAARKAGKAAGILLLRPDQVEGTVKDGFTFVALGSDSGLVANGMPQLLSAFEAYRSRSD